MQYVSVWNVIQAMTINFEISEDERAESLRLHEDVIEVRNEGAPSPLKGVSMGEFRAQVVRNLASSFATAHKLSQSAAVLENMLHHAQESMPALFDLRQTGLPRFSPSAFSELQAVLINLAQFEARLGKALSQGKFRGFPRHGGPKGVGISPDDWTSHPQDGDTLNQIVFHSEEIQRFLRARDVSLGRLHDVFTKMVVDDLDQDVATNHAAGPRAGAMIPLQPGYDDLELAPIERRHERSDREQVPSLSQPSGRTPKKFTDEVLAHLIQRNKHETWQQIADSLGMKKETLEDVHVGPFRRKMRKAEHDQQPPANPFEHAAATLIKKKAPTKPRP